MDDLIITVADDVKNSDDIARISVDQGTAQQIITATIANPNGQDVNCLIYFHLLRYWNCKLLRFSSESCYTKIINEFGNDGLEIDYLTMGRIPIIRLIKTKEVAENLHLKFNSSQ